MHGLTADRAAEFIRGVRPRDAAIKTLRGLAADLISEVRQLDRRISKAPRDIDVAVKASGTTLPELHGVGALTAGKSSAGLAISTASDRPLHSLATPVLPPSKCPPATWCATGSPAPATASSTFAYMS
jgi:hypothetical protein